MSGLAATAPLAWWGVQLPPGDDDIIQAPGNTQFTAVVEIRSGFNTDKIINTVGLDRATGLVPQNAPVFAGWTMNQLGTSEDGPWNPAANPTAPWNALLTRPAPNGHQWAFVQMTSPPGGGSAPRAYTATVLGLFAYRIDALWQLGPADAPPKALGTSTSDAYARWVPWAVGGALAAVATAGWIGYRRGWFRALKKVL